MKKILSILLIAVIMVSLLCVSAYADDESALADTSNETSVANTSNVNEVSDTVSDTVSENASDVSNEETGSMFSQSIEIMLFGMIGIFAVTAILVLSMYLLTLIKDKK